MHESATTQSFKLDPNLDTVQQKQKIIGIIHKRLGPISFNKLKFLDKARLIPKYLLNVYPPTFPGCTYKKSRRSP